MELSDLRVVSTLLVVSWALVLVALERRFPYDRGQRLLRTGFFTDFVWYTLFHGFWLGLLISALIEHLDRWTGWSRLQLVSGWPLWTQLILFLITHDLYIYWFHRLQHRSRLLFRTHEAHHSVKDVDWVAGSRSHALEILINQTIEYAPIVLLGAAPEIAILKGLVDALWGMWIHCNVDVRTGWLQRIINGPEMHRWHHAVDLAPPGKNFATKLALWDWVFGTAYLPRGAKPSGYGLYPEEQAAFPAELSLREDLLPLGYLRQHLFAFRRRPILPLAEPK